MFDTGIRWRHALAGIGCAVLLQVAVFDQILVADRLRLDLPLFLVIGIGFAASSTNAAILGFAVGLAVDLFQFGPFGLHALVFCLVSWALAEAKLRALQPGRSFRTVQGGMAAIAVTSVTWLAGAVFGQSPPEFSVRSLVLLALTGVVGGVVVHPATVLGEWMLGAGRPARVDAAVAR